MSKKDNLNNGNSNKVTLSNKEKIAVTKALFLRYIPQLLGIILCFGITMLLIYLWLN